MSRQVTCGYLGQASRHGAACQSPLLTAADPCIWHDCGTRRAEGSEPGRLRRCPVVNRRRRCANLSFRGAWPVALTFFA